MNKLPYRTPTWMSVLAVLFVGHITSLVLILAVTRDTGYLFFWAISLLAPVAFLFNPLTVPLTLIPLPILVGSVLLWWFRPHPITFWIFAASALGWSVWMFVWVMGATYNV